MKKINYIKINSTTLPSGWIENTAIPTNHPTLFIVGGAYFSAPLEHQIYEFLSTLVNSLAPHAPFTFIDGGTDSGVMKVFNQAISKFPATHQYLGFAPELKIYPRIPLKPKEIGPAHTHLILTEGESYGDERQAIFQYLAVVKPQAPILCILINGGENSKKEIRAARELQIPIAIINGSGRLADELSNAPQYQKDPLIHILNIKENTLHLVNYLQKLLLSSGG